MRIWNSLRKQIATKEIMNSKRIISLFIVGTALFLLIFSPLLPSSNDGETTHNSIFKVDVSFPLQSSYEQELHDHGVKQQKKRNISVEIHNRSQSPEYEHRSKNESSHGDKRKNHQNGLQVMTLQNRPKTIDAEPVVEEVHVRNKDGTHYLNISSSNNPSRPSSQCDIYSGRWVQDDLYPLYPAGECPYISPDFNCKQNGRRDFNYTKWRWQSTHCHIPRLDAMDMLERMRGKRLMFVGDSISRNQWESLLCILRTAIIDQNRIFFGQSKDGLNAFVAQDYNCSVEFFWAPFLVEQGNIKAGNENKEILKLDSIENHGAHWKDVDILIFNTGHWWTHGNKVQLRDFYMEGEYLHGELEPLEAFKRGLTTWSKWIDKNIDPNKTKVVFRGFSPNHFSSNQWKKKKGHKCNFETQPILNEVYLNPYPARMKMVDEVLLQMAFPVSLMNITRLSDFRKDAHPSIYTLRKKKQLTQEQRNDPDRYGDCSHWCLPGLPDIWNELLYEILLTEGFHTPH